MSDFLKVLEKAADSAVAYLNGQSQSNAALAAQQQAAQSQLYVQSQQMRAAELKAETSQKTMMYVALAVGGIVLVVMLSRKGHI